MTYRCKRCGKRIKTKLSVSRMLGPTCYEIVQLERLEEKNIQKTQEKTVVPEDIQTELGFLRMEIKFLKHQLNELKNTGFSNAGRIETIERVKQDEHRPERNVMKIQFNVVIKELKIVLENKNLTTFKKGFRFDDFDLGIKSEEEIIELMNSN